MASAQHLVAEHIAAHKRDVAKPLFDYALRALRRDRALARGPALFLYDRSFGDIIERLSAVRRPFTSALLIGAPNPDWPRQLGELTGGVTVFDPGPRMADKAGGSVLTEDEDLLEPDTFDLCVAVGTLDTVNQVPIALANIHNSLRPGALLIGAMSGGETLPRLRASMLAADQVGETVSPRIHPRLDGPTLGGLLASAGFTSPVVDVERIAVSYTSLSKLIDDLRSMGTTNILKDRSRIPLGRHAMNAAHHKFNEFGSGGRTTETFEILHFAAWKSGDT